MVEDVGRVFRFMLWPTCACFSESAPQFICLLTAHTILLISSCLSTLLLPVLYLMCVWWRALSLVWRLLIHAADGFLCCVAAFRFCAITAVNSWDDFLSFWSSFQKALTCVCTLKHYPIAVSSPALKYTIYLELILFLYRVGEMNLLSSFCMTILHFLAPFIKEAVLLPMNIFDTCIIN